MKSFIAMLCGGFALATTATAGPAVILSGKGYYDKERVVLNVFADSAVQLRTFGIRLGYNPEVVGEPAVFANDALWFLSAQPGQRSVYTPAPTDREFRADRRCALSRRGTRPRCPRSGTAARHPGLPAGR